MDVPSAWYNVLPDLGFDLPPDRPSPDRVRTPLRVQVPPALIRQELSRKRWIEIPPEVADRYAQWRPTPLRRAETFERRIGTRSRIYYKYEGGNLSGSHKLNTAMAQVYYYQRAGARRLTVGTGAGQWGTAVAAACAVFGLHCTVYMVGSSYRAKPGRRSLMEFLGAEVIPSPSDRTDSGRHAAASDPGGSGSLSIALAEAVEDARSSGDYFCTGSGETYSLLHQTVIGLETMEQLDLLGTVPDTVVASIGGGSNLGGIALPFLGRTLRGGRPVRVIAAEPSACPKLTQGRYEYDFTDASRLTPLQLMYTLGHDFAAPPDHTGGLRYHGAAKLISALYHRRLMEAVACSQAEAFATAADFAETEGLLPAPESAFAIHATAEAALQADAAGRPGVLLVCVSGHGLYDLAAYQAFREGAMGRPSSESNPVHPL